ncbi:hypothetical protein HY285_04005 [Candidatus Peregrinibacteria bacterium]|nr:hypothetical protein [Candidatus Peregrinibacteria bacterium]
MQTLRKHVVLLAGLLLIAVSIFLGGGSATFAASPDVTIDNGDPGFSTQGPGWSAGGGGGYHNNYLMHGPLLKGLPAQKAIWVFQGLPDGTYRVWVSWKGGVPNASTKALFSAFDGAASAGSFTIDETQDPPQALNVQRWAIALPSVQVHSGTFRVELPAMEKDTVVADAIKVIRIPASADIALLSVKSKTKTTNVLFTQSFNNLGVDPADSFALSVDTIPKGLLFDAANSDNHCVQTNQSISCAGVPSNTDITISLIPDPNAPCSPTVSYTVRFSSSEADPAPANNGKTIVAAVICPSLNVSIDGPASQQYPRGQSEADLGDITLSAKGAKIDVRRMYVAIQASTKDGQPLSSANDSQTDEIAEVLTHVSLRNSVTGKSIDAVRLTGGSDKGEVASIGTYQIYLLNDVSLNEGSNAFQFNVDFDDNGSAKSPMDGDQFKIHICTESTQLPTGSNTKGCTFAGLIASNIAYQLQAENHATGITITDVKPGGTVSGNAQIIANPTLTLEQKSIGTLGTAVKNQKNVNLLRFDGQATVKDILATQFVFSSASGSLNNGENYTLRVDTDNDGKVDTILQEGVSAQNGEVTFGKLTGSGFVFPKDRRVTLEVHADIAASLTNHWLQLKFATSNTHYVEAENVVTGASLSGIKTDGVCASSCDIIVTTTASEAYRLVNQGDLYVTQDAVPTGRHQFLGGVLGAPALSLQFHAENEDIDVTNLQITATGSTASSVDHLELYNDGATTPFTLATIGTCGSDKVPANTRCAKMQNQELVIGKGTDVNVLVRPFMKTDVNGAISGEKIQLYIAGKAVSNDTTGEGAVRARGVQSSNSLSASNENGIVNEGEVMIGNTDGGKNKDIVGLKHVSVLSKITSITNAGSDTGVMPTGVADIGQFTIAAAAHDNSQNGLNKVVLSGVLLTVNAANVEIDATSLRFYNKVDSTSTKTCVPHTTGGVKIVAATISGSFLGSCTDFNGSSVTVAIDQGTDATFVVRMSITNPKISASANSTLQVSLQNFNDAALTTFGATKSHFAWIDQDNGSATTSSFTWAEYPDATVKSTLYQN